jgi:hypothetical protein
MSVKVRKGTQFRSVIADCSALWEVTSVKGDTAYAVVVDEPFEIGGVTYPGEYAGQEDVFLVDTIKSRLALSAVLTSLDNRREDFFENLTPGDVYHYHNGFGEYVRCVVTESHEFQPIALIGEWRQYDLYRVDATGKVHHGYHAAKILSGEGAWQPSETCVYESDEFVAPRGEGRDFDPRLRDPLDLTPPTPTAEETLRHELWKAWYAAGEAIDNHRDEPIELILPRVIENLATRVDKALGVTA